MEMDHIKPPTMIEKAGSQKFWPGTDSRILAQTFSFLISPPMKRINVSFSSLLQLYIYDLEKYHPKQVSFYFLLPSRPFS